MYNPILIASITSLVVAQIFKFIRRSIRIRGFDIPYLIAAGGFPSSHAALTSSLAFSCILFTGLSSDVSTITIVFALVTIFDAMGVRKLAEKHSIVINALLKDLLHYAKTSKNEELVTKFNYLSKQKLSENAGHTPKQVIAGIVVGIIISVIIYLIWPH